MKKSHKKISTESAHTLIEILFVIVILAGILGIAIPTIRTALQDSTEKRESANIQSLNQAAERARIKGIVGPGTYGSDKNAALAWYLSEKLINETPINLIGVFYNFGRWEISTLPQNTTELVNLIASQPGTFSPTQIQEIATRIGELGATANTNLLTNPAITGDLASLITLQNGLASAINQGDTSGWNNIDVDEALLSYLELTVPFNTDGSVLAQMDYSNISFQDASFNNANLQGANISGASFVGASSLSNVNFSGLNLTGYDATGTIISNSNFTNAQGLSPNTFTNAIAINGINLSGTGITKAQLDAALIAAGKNPTSGDFDTSTIAF